jgi:peptide/nickel transport system permease protein
MPPFLQFLIRRLISIPITLLFITMFIYAGVMLTPVEARAQLFIPPGKGGERASDQYVENIIKQNHLNDPFLVQYGYWAKALLGGNWGWSPTLRQAVLPTLMERTPATMELALYSMLLFIPIGIANGLLAGWKHGERADTIFRFTAFIGTSMPPFILSFILLAIFYTGLNWFQPDRLSMAFNLQVSRAAFHQYTGFMTIDALLNQRTDIFWDALRHLALPVFTLSIFHWATLGRITRATIITERRKEYIIAARARGVKERSLVWKHAYRAILAPSLTSVALSAASILTGVMVVEIIFNFNGISSVILSSMRSAPDAAAALGFSVYCVIMVVVLMFIMDLMQAIFDPRVRDEVLKA